MIIIIIKRVVKMSIRYHSKKKNVKIKTLLDWCVLLYNNNSNNNDNDDDNNNR